MRFDDRPILVTGAGGFIGGRLVEVLALSGKADVRASVRRWASAARIGRFPVETVRCDITEKDQVRAAMRGVGAVIHCAKGGRTGTVEGTRNILEAAREMEVSRVVFFSTIEVYGDMDGDLDESIPPQRTGRDYGDSKIEAEELCAEFAADGLPVVVLRPSLVYGPFSTYWTVEVAQRLMQGGTFPSRDAAAGICNLVYVDDVVAATLLSLQRDEAVGEVFNVNGPERLTWSEYLYAFRDALELPDDPHGGRLSTRIRSMAMTPVRAGAKAILSRFEGPLMALNKRSPIARRAMKSFAGAIQRTPSQGEYRLLSRNAFFPIEKARRLMGYQPMFTMEKGLDHSLAWLDHHGFRGKPRPIIGGDQPSEEEGSPADQERHPTPGSP